MRTEKQRSHSSAMLARKGLILPGFCLEANIIVGRRKDSVLARSRTNCTENYFPPGTRSNSYFPDPHFHDQHHPRLRAPDKSARPVNGFPPSVTCCEVSTFGNPRLPVVFCGTSNATPSFHRRVSNDPRVHTGSPQTLRRRSSATRAVGIKWRVSGCFSSISNHCHYRGNPAPNRSICIVNE